MENGSCPNTVTGVSAELFFTLINTIVSTKCAFNPASIYPKNCGPNLKDGDSFDFIVVGSGSAGSVVASKLSDNQKWKVLLLEAGGYPPTNTEIPGLFATSLSPDDNWSYQTEPTNNVCQGFVGGRCNWQKGKMLGGTSSMQFTLYLRGNKRDYDYWAELGNKNWNYDNVLKYFKEMENVPNDTLPDSTNYGRNGLLKLSLDKLEYPMQIAFQKGAEELGYPTLKEEGGLGYLQTLLTRSNGEKQNSAKAFLSPIRSRENLHVAMKAFVTKILVNAKSKVAEGVEVQINGKNMKLYAKKETILSAGAISSAQILMLSGIGPKEHLEKLGIEVVKDLAVGKNLQDHLLSGGVLAVVGNSQDQSHNEMVDQIYEYFMYRKGNYKKIGLLNLVGFINTKNDSAYPNVEMYNVLFPEKSHFLLPHIVNSFGFRKDVADYLLSLNQKHATIYFGSALINPKSRGEILLNTTDPFDRPLIYPNYLSDEKSEDMETILKSIRVIEKLIKSKAIARYEVELIKLPVCQEHKFKSDDYWRCTLRYFGTTGHQPAGTCKMGPKSDKTAVVDSKLRIYGVKKLRVIDASIMPKMISANTNGAVMMIGLKGAHMIIKAHTDH